MKTLRSILGYSAAALSILIMVATFPSIGILGEPLVTATGLTLSPNYTGGEVMRTIDHGTYQTQIHRPVFDDTLIGERKRGFVQVSWRPLVALPAHIDEEIDVDEDGTADFRIQVETASQRATLVARASWVHELEWALLLKESLAVRVIVDRKE